MQSISVFLDIAKFAEFNIYNSNKYSAQKAWMNFWALKITNIAFVSYPTPIYRNVSKFYFDVLHHNCLTILKGKNCVLFHPVQEMAGWLLLTFFDMFTKSIKFYYTLYYYVLRVQMFEKCDASNRQ